MGSIGEKDGMERKRERNEWVVQEEKMEWKGKEKGLNGQCRRKERRHSPPNPTKSSVSVPQITVVRTESLVEGERGSEEEKNVGIRKGRFRKNGR